MTAIEIIQEALEVAFNDTPKTLLDKLFYREPSESKLKSSAINYLTNRVLKAEDSQRKAEQRLYEIHREALHIIEQFSPDEALKFYNLSLLPQEKGNKE